MLKLSTVFVFSEKPKDLAKFYSRILDAEPAWKDGDYSGFDTGQGMLIVGMHDKVHGKNTAPERIMFNLETEDVGSEFERIRKMGTRVIQGPYNPGEDESMTIATFADPDGNYFQVVSPFKGMPD